MKNSHDKNKIPLAIIIAAMIIAVAIFLTRRPFALENPQMPPFAKSPSKHISFDQAPDNIGKVVCVTGKVDHVYTSPKGTVFINFCPDYKTCPFGAVIFDSSVSKFPNPQQYAGKNVEITGFITAYQGRAEIVLDSPAQIKIEQ
jgi:DNA/RNA endonuclease YhcR with UshA esterase domain